MEREAHIIRTYKKKIDDEINLVHIVYDEAPTSPREHDNFGTLVCVSKKYALGDINFTDMEKYEDFMTYMFCEGKAACLERVELPVYMYDHSCLRLSTAPFRCPWDSGRVGTIYVSKHDMEEKGISEKEAKRILESEIQTLDNYSVGSVFGYQHFIKRKCETCKRVNKDLVSSCYGFIGSGIEESGILQDAGIDDAWKEVEHNE